MAITALTKDVLATGPGSVPATVVQLSGAPLSVADLGTLHVVGLPTGSTIVQTGGGTLAVPTDEYPLLVQPRDPAKAPFGFRLNSTLFNATIDTTFSLGYNPGGVVLTSEPTVEYVTEQDYEVNPGVHWMEQYFQQYQSAHANAVRPWYSRYNRASGGSTVSISCQLSGGDGGTVNIVENSTLYSMLYASQAQTVLKSLSTTIQSDSSLLNLTSASGIAAKVGGGNQFSLTQTTAGQSTYQLFYDSAAVERGVIGYFYSGSAMLLAGVGAVDIQIIVNGSGAKTNFVMDQGSGNIQLLSNTGAKSFGAGVGVLGIHNAATIPTVAAANGGIIYCDPANGNLYFWGTSGVARLIALA